MRVLRFTRMLEKRLGAGRGGQTYTGMAGGHNVIDRRKWVLRLCHLILHTAICLFLFCVLLVKNTCAVKTLSEKPSGAGEEKTGKNKEKVSPSPAIVVTKHNDHQRLK